ncbi:MAG TPA: hypothetical protein VJN18_27335 [Polyangiaceae bacterium]|nr:hypothetical protein [Polyangiaceae bacterium]
MKTSIRWWSRLAFIAGMGLSAVTACSSDRNDGKGQEQNVGTLSLPLQATAPSGNVYMLRNASFQITNARTGETVDFLTTENGMPEATVLKRLLNVGDYTLTLLPGWFLERVATGSSGSGGASPGGFGGTTSKGGFPGKLFAEPRPKKPPVPGAGGEPAGAAGETGVGGAGPGPGPIEGGAGPIAGGAGPVDGGASTGGSGGSGPVVVDAQLVSNAVQFFSIFSQGDSFVHYQFRIGGEIVDFNQGRLNIFFDVEEVCVPPDGALMPERILLETNVDAVNNVSLFGVLEALSTNGGRNDDPVALYQQIWDSYATADQASLPDAIHCGDETTDGVATLNGYPIDCDRQELFQVDNLGSFFPTAFVNRIDLAPANGAHCGQQRMIFASNALRRAFVIVEAQIPNPTPELGIEGCVPLAKFWLAQNDIDDPFERGNRMAQAFLLGDPELVQFGFGPFYTAENITVGSGQIRTNTFDQDPWALREFKLALDGDTLRAVPFPVAESPHGALWNENSPLPQGPACRENFLSALEGLLTDDMSQMSFVVDGPCKNSESRNDSSEDYSRQLSDGFRDELEARLLGTGLDADDIANRAQFAGSCIGCHMEARGRFLGNGVFAPEPFDFPQVLDFAQQCTGGEQGLCFPVSNALTETFLPGRLQVLSSLLGIPIPPNPCDGGGGGFGGTFGTAGSSSVGGGFASAGTPSMGPGLDEPTPAPVIEIELPSVEEPIEVLEEQDAEIRESYGDVTLSGRSAKVTH